jgi:sulfoxide reductase heme-binding subunit YedZ
MIMWALSIGPVNVIRGDANPVHSPLRRDVGIAGGLMAVAHTIVGLQVHVGGQLSRYFLPPPVMHRTDKLFLAANWMGLFSTLLLVGLVTISNNPSLRSLGLQTWKFLQRWAYPAAALAVLHGIAFQLLERRSKPVIALVALTVLAVIALQLKGRNIKLGNRA